MPSKWNYLPAARRDNDAMNELLLNLGAAEHELLDLLVEWPRDPEDAVRHVGIALRGIRKAQVATLDVEEIHNFWARVLKEEDDEKAKQTA